VATIDMAEETIEAVVMGEVIIGITRTIKGAAMTITTTITIGRDIEMITSRMIEMEGREDIEAMTGMRGKNRMKVTWRSMKAEERDLNKRVMRKETDS
jgi:hypothetical protein